MMHYILPGDLLKVSPQLTDGNIWIRLWDKFPKNMMYTRPNRQILSRGSIIMTVLTVLEIDSKPWFYVMLNFSQKDNNTGYTLPIMGCVDGTLTSQNKVTVIARHCARL